MTLLQYFELKWLHNKYMYMLETGQHIPNTKKWEFIDNFCHEYENSDNLDEDISVQSLNYIHNCIIPGFIKGMTDGEIRTFEYEKANFFANNTVDSIRDSYENLRKKKEEEAKDLEDTIKKANEYYQSDVFEDIMRSYR